MHLLYLRAIIDVRGKSNSSKNSLLVAVCPRDKIGLSGRFRTYYPQSVVRRLINYFIFFHHFLFTFRLLVGILSVLFSRRSPLRLQE